MHYKKDNSPLFLIIIYSNSPFFKFSTLQGISFLYYQSQQDINT